MRQIVYSLTGSENISPIMDRMLERFVERLRDDFEDIVWSEAFMHSSKADEIFYEYSKISENKRIELLLSPMFFRTVCLAKETSADGKIQALLQILEQCNGESLSSTADLDNFLQIGGSDNVYRLGGTILADLGSESCRRTDASSPVFMTEFEPFSNDEKRVTLEKLARAMSEIDETSSSFARLIRNYTRRIYIRKVAGHVPASEQVDTEIGAIRLRNVQLESYSHDDLVDTLIHESIHNFLGTFEYLEFPFLPFGRRPAGDIRPVSPWSERPIRTLPFLHACFVYFAMFHYCQIRMHHKNIDSDERARLVERSNKYASGFLMPGRLSTYASSLSMVDPRVSQAIDWMENVILEKYSIT